MKLTTNFLPSSRWLVQATAATLSALCVLGGGSLMALTVDAVQMRRQLPVAIAAMERLQRRKPESPGAPLPPAAALAALQGRVRMINQLGLGGGMGASGVLARLEVLLPAGAALSGFQFDQRRNDIQFEAESRSLEVLSRFLLSLENDEAFIRVLLVKQDRRDRGGASWVTFTIRMRERRS